METGNQWTPDRDQAIRALIRSTIMAAGDIPPNKLPHHVRATLREQINGNVDIEAYVAEILAEERKKGR